MALVNTRTREAKADARAIQQVLAGNPDAFEHLVESHFPLVYAIAYARLGEVEAAEDLAQEVFLSAFMNLPRLEKPEAFPSWVARMARNLGINWALSNTRASRLLPMVNLEDKAMDALPDERRTAREELEGGAEEEGVPPPVVVLFF